ncbi:hypothetical protein EV651_116138 [Kribbella sp. VKM Ac-2571]|uniref:hypothetical protein n=1 Tax=Kribbella sp. VKM Ac-2571 TaxID=2512222 RepID=UPI00105D9C71|nr:hypothetical protein [Kribbella sp. VKM Ac-2571]TDO54134.1 hypothetical protein EV651_116138 [Kribbella sp. VKM Ac-2571]
MTDNARPSLDELDQMPDDMSQEDQAALLVEPSFDHDIDNEAEELEAEFGPAEDGEFGRKPPAGDQEPSLAGGGAES